MNRLYNKARQAFLSGDISWDADNIKTILVDAADYTPDFALDEFLSDIPGAAVVTTSANLTGKTVTDGIADAADVTYSAVTGDECEIIVAYVDTGTPSTSRLIGHIDTATGLPVTPNGGDIQVQWDNGANKIFKL